jgi:phospholipid/cholesterol/gamma-HCH transport system substrate-binding protein
VKRAIRDHARDFAAIVGLLVISLAVSTYILREQRFQFPLIDEKPFVLNAELENAQAVTPGQGQTVEVAGVKVGRMGAVTLKNGRAIVRLDMFPKYRRLVREDAKALLRPRTGLKDMFLQLDPGSGSAPVAREKFTIPVRNTMTDVDLDEILSSLDTDTRAYLALLVDGTGKGLKDRGGDLAELFERFGPTLRDLRRVNQAVAQERDAVKDAVHGLALLSEELAGKDDDLARVVDSSASVFEALAAEDRNVSQTVRQLPEALRTATATLGDVERLAGELGPTSERLVPVFDSLNRANRAITPVARAITPPIRDQIRPFTREARPLVGNLATAASGLGESFPDLTTSFDKLNKFFNMLAFNPNGREAPDKADRQEGYLFWLAWVTHISANLVNIDDGNGPLRPVFLTGTCQTLTTLINNEPQLEFLMGLSALLQEQCDAPNTKSLQPARVAKDLAKKAKVARRVARDLAKKAEVTR